MPQMVSLLSACFIAGNRPVTVLSLPSVSISRDWIDVAALAISAALMIVGAIGVGAAIKTLKAVEKQAVEMVEQAKLMKEQTNVAKDAADAALLNAQSVINSERPWLLIRPSLALHGNPGTALTVAFKATNVGRSPAEIIYAALEWQHLLFGEELHRNGRFLSEDMPVSTQWVHTRWIEPNESFIPDGLEGRCHIDSGDTPELWKYLVDGARILIVAGYIRYRDAISNGVHESRYCYSVSPKFRTIVMTGPPGYNKLT